MIWVKFATIFNGLNNSTDTPYLFWIKLVYSEISIICYSQNNTIIGHNKEF